MAHKNRWYVGLATGEEMQKGTRWVFCSAFVPTLETHGRLYLCVIGPFDTLAGAEFMRDFGKGNPHCQTVDDAERLALTAT